ncbi:Tat pathway signal sequence domain protein [Streptomyces sp. NPDC050504]|uniref:Tat pathway signal sequence domain protein n=1 Tax=Streptomyces sp. NPDC050504 TaxID=3365618 RepID=UPI00379816A8
MRELMRRHLGKLVAGAAVAVTGTAAMVAITLPGTAGADDNADGRRAAAGSAREAGRDAGSDPAGQGGRDGSGAPPPPGTFAAAPADGEVGTGSDPLTDGELRRADQIAFTPDARTAARDVEGQRGPQRLGVNLADPVEGEAATVRRADVSYYDYGTDRLITKTVNLTTGKVERTGSQSGVQPSAHRDELREAVELILASPLGKGLKQDYQDATDKPLTTPDQLWFNGDIYRTYREKNVPDQLAKCGEHRCVRLVTKVKNGPWINARSLIVDLSARTVVHVG